MYNLICLKISKHNENANNKLYENMILAIKKSILSMNAEIIVKNSEQIKIDLQKCIENLDFFVGLEKPKTVKIIDKKWILNKEILKNEDTSPRKNEILLTILENRNFNISKKSEQTNLEKIIMNFPKSNSKLPKRTSFKKIFQNSSIFSKFTFLRNMKKSDAISYNKITDILRLDKSLNLISNLINAKLKQIFKKIKRTPKITQKTIPTLSIKSMHRQSKSMTILTPRENAPKPFSIFAVDKKTFKNAELTYRQNAKNLIGSIIGQTTDSHTTSTSSKPVFFAVLTKNERDIKNQRA